MEGLVLTHKLNHEFNIFYRHAFSVVTKVPGYFIPMMKHLYWQRRASARRAKHESELTHIPPFLIFSITQKCNLNCAGCYSRNLHKQDGEDLSLEKIDTIISEAEALGISVIMLAGGEPLLRKDILSVAEKYPRILFPLFTNGLLIDAGMAAQVRKSKNIIPIISIEGGWVQTDQRRGKGVFELVLENLRILVEQRVLFGTSITVTQENFDIVTDEAFVAELKAKGCKLIFYIEYIPCSDSGQQHVITPDQRRRLKAVTANMQRKYQLMFVSFPGDEEIFGGCLAAGRGFVHISNTGSLEPCPFSPYSDINLNNTGLQEALQSRFLREIRENSTMLSEHQGGCALWENREWVEKTLSRQKHLS